MFSDRSRQPGPHGPPLPRGWPVLALGLALVSCRGHGGAGPEPTPAATEPENAEVGALLRLAEVQTARLPAEAQQRLLRIAAEQKCPCAAEPGTLSECARAGHCVRARFAVRAVLRGLSRDEKDTDITARLLERFGPREPEKVDLDGVPCRGPADAPAVMVLFSDFECPWCALGRELVELLQKQAGSRLRVCFKHLPLIRLHEHSQLAAQAAVAAQRQDRFWPMHDRLFTHQKELARDDLIEHARALGLDLDRFRRDLDSSEVVARVKRDADEAARLRLRGTPSFLINGREMTDPKTPGDFLDWIAEAVALRRQ
jgi:protein-disulfide isomerase